MGVAPHTRRALRMFSSDEGAIYFQLVIKICTPDKKTTHKGSPDPEDMHLNKEMNDLHRCNTML